MIDIGEVVSRLKKEESFYINYCLPAWELADIIVKELGRFSVSEYDIFDIFSRDVIENYILLPGEDCLLAGMIGGKLESFVKPDSTELIIVDHSDMIPLYQKVFGEWEEKGWIIIEMSPGSERLISVRIND